MLGLRLTSEVQKRWKNGEAAPEDDGRGEDEFEPREDRFQGVTTTRSPLTMPSPPMKK